MEIERKFLVKQIPKDYKTYPRIVMTQAYLNVNPVVRIRKENDDYVLTYKAGGGLSRQECNLPLDAQSFDHLLEKADGIILNKTRYQIPLSQTLTAELDLFFGDYQGLSYVEVEFASEKEALAFVPPNWFGKEVTYDHKFSNSSLSQGKIPLSELQ